VYEADLDPHVGTEQAGKRPVIIVQTEQLNKIPTYGQVVVVPTTAEQVDQKRRYPNNDFIPKGEAKLPSDSIALCGQVRSISRQRLMYKRGELSDATMREIEDALRLVLEL
jgi:mRNA interferase MazF